MGFCEHFLCSNDIFNPGYSRKMLIEIEHPFLTDFALLMHSYFMQFNAPLEKYVNVNQKIFSVCHEWLIFCQHYINFVIFDV